MSSRAEKVRLIVSARRGLEVVVPRRFDRSLIPGLVDKRRVWIERAIARVAAREEAEVRRLERDPPRLPERIVLPAVDEEWVVEYRRGPARRSSATGAAIIAVRERPGRRLVVAGDIDDFESCRSALLRWLRRRAKKALVPRVAEIAGRHRLEYRRVSVRLQLTRWGSCSRTKTISLNAKLLFLQRELVDYVLLHELCHTADMSHSVGFWRRIAVHDVDWQAHRLMLRGAGAAVPTWVDNGIEVARV